MGLSERLDLYRQLESKRGRPLIAYVTSNRTGVDGQIAADAVPEFHSQLQSLPRDATDLDLLIVSDGGDGTVAWRVVSLIRERVKHFSVLVPQAAFSAATLIALGADEIVMHPNGNLGPTDPQIITPRRAQKDGSSGQVRFGYEDLAAFLRFAQEKVGLGDQKHMLEVFRHFCDEVGSVPIGVAARSSQLTVTMGERLLGLHMKEEERQKARAISEALNTKFFHHGYPVSRNEAKEIGLKVGKSDVELEELMWSVWQDMATELELRTPFQPLGLLREDPQYKDLFGPVPQVQIPANLPPQMLQQVFNQVLQQVAMTNLPPKEYQVIHALMESPRLATRFVSEGTILATRTPDLQIKLAVVRHKLCWRDVDLPKSSTPDVRGPAKAAGKENTGLSRVQTAARRQKSHNRGGRPGKV